ncbi:hypothetical protein CAPTEDRAFT_208808 [Capitella teleta]|uniref:DET1 homolog n=1 Tax=Capitella teleta TaxID=283909 RepID=R7VF65_CAPTE|nr:hypothetical protein CAPTEDRAFT_208808 [Capitella teleta]|eukprot:ELU14951.1 hypothetical protein CAPTEDRAFT_208808 [Capitella teleta]
MQGCVSEKEQSDGIVPRRIPQQNIVQRLFHRETNQGKPGTSFHTARTFHTNFFPNYTVVNVDKPPCFLRKFSPDGRYFVAFSSNQMSIEIYEFQGSSAAEHLFQPMEGEFMCNSDPRAAKIKNELFGKFFKLRHITSVASNGENLNRECSLFTDDGRFVIVGSAAYVPDDPHPYFFDVYRNNESVSPNARSSLENYSLHLVELSSGRLCDSRNFKVDKIFLSHNQGLYLYHNTLAVLSIQQQTIHVFQVSPDGSFIDVRSIGRFCYEDDQLLIAGSVPPARTTVERPFREPSINALKHRLMVHLYERACHECDEEQSPTPLLKFYQHFEQFLKLRMWKMQLLDEQHLFIKYASEDVVTLKIHDPNLQPSFFVIYNMVTTEVVTVFENTSEELLDLFENFSDLFRNATLHCEAQFMCSASSNVHARQLHQRFKQTIISAKFGGETEAIKRLLAQLPISSQSYSCSPYLDLALFSYDDKWVSPLERPKACGDHPIRFYARDSGLLKFKIHTGLLHRNPTPTARRLVAFTFHPFEPFAISVQRTNSEYVVNFHVRHCVV